MMNALAFPGSIPDPASRGRHPPCVSSASAGVQSTTLASWLPMAKSARCRIARSSRHRLGAEHGL